MKPLSLFDDQDDRLCPAADRKEPVVWVRRIAVVESPNPAAKVVREVAFRRGLNIIRTAERQDDEARTVGHSVGKTLLLRLIRYCLGEEAFSTAAGRQTIAKRISEGFVAAEVFVAGDPWVVARPIGFDHPTSGSKASRGDAWRQIFVSWSEAGKYGLFAEALAHAVLSGMNVAAMPHDTPARQWLDLLGWLARDQNCRYRHHHEWRDKESGSGTGRLAFENASTVIRVAMSLLTADEVSLRSEQRRLVGEANKLEAEIARLDAYLTLTQRRLARMLGITERIPAAGLFANAAVDKATQTRDSLKRLLADEQDSTKLETLDRRRIQCIEEEVLAGRELQQTRAVRETETQRLEKLKKQGQDMLMASYDQLGGFCGSFVSEAEARAAGCNYVPTRRTPGEPDPGIERDKRELEQQIAALDSEIQSMAERHGELVTVRQDAEKAWRGEADAFRTKIANLSRRIGEYENIISRAKRLRNEIKAHRRLETRLTANKTLQSDALVRQQQARERLKSRRRRLSQYFSRTLTTLIGPGVSGRIQMGAKGIYPKLAGSAAASGEAMATSATVLGFDLSCLIASICGLGHLPRLLMHDSPREADMERPMYHRLFQLMFDLEAVFDGAEPSFQYIVTTTTQPPAMSPDAPYVRLTLDARNIDDLLLCMRF